MGPRGTGAGVRAGFLWAAIALSSGPAHQARVASRTAALDAEPRLAAAVTLRVRQAPLCDVLAQVSRDTGVPLEPSEDTADERVSLFVRGRPAREVLAKVAEHLDYTWVWQTRRGTRTLVLIQDLAAKRRELALRGGSERDVAALREQVERRLEEAGAPEAQALRRQPREERLKRLAQAEDELFGPVIVERDGNGKNFNRVPPKPGPSPQEKARLEHELKLLQAVTPESRRFNARDIACTAYAALPPPLREALWRGEPVSLAYPPERDRVPLTKDQATELVAGGLGNLAQREDEATGLETPVPFQAVERVRVTLALHRRGAETRLATRLRTVGSFGDERSHTRVEWVVREEELDARRWTPHEAGWGLDEGCRRLRQPVKLPEPPKEPSPGSGPAVAQAEETTSFEDVLEQLADRTPYAIVADGYYTGDLSGPLVKGEKPLCDVLERATRIFNRRCRLDGSYLLFRHGDWATKRATEPPARLVRRWEESIRKYAALPFRDVVEMGGRLTPEQTEILEARWNCGVAEGLLELLKMDLRQSGPVLRLLRALPAGLRKSLNQGEELPLHLLPPAAVAGAREAILESTAEIHGYEGHNLADEKPYVAGTGFALEDRLEALWNQARIRLSRRPITWVFTSLGVHLIEKPDDLKEAMDQERGFTPPGQPVKLQRIEGELIEVSFRMPGVEPVSHFFLDPGKPVEP